MAVVGAGPAGLVTVKELLDEGHAPACFERADGPGGVFRFGEADGVVWESCRLTSSGVLTAFSDFPVDAEHGGHMRVREYVQYLASYCEKFDLSRHVRFGTTVEEVRRDPAGGWIVRTRGAQRVQEEHYDAVALCSGLHQYPHVPEYPGQETFTGSLLHGAQYRRPSQVAGKRVLIVGAGESGADVVAESAAHASETVLSLRRGVSAQPRNIFGRPRDQLTSRLMNGAAHWVFQTRNPADDRKRKVYRWTFLPFVFADKCLQLLYVFFWEFLPLLRAPSLDAMRINLRTRRLTKQLLKESGGTINENFGTKTDDFVRAIARGRCRRAPAILRFEGPRVVFTDGSAFAPDLVVFCTGFDTRMPYLDAELASAPRFLHTFNPEVGASLGFVGFARPAFGAMPPIAELQSRWFALLLSGKRALPPTEAMLEAIDYWTDYRAHVFRAVKANLEQLVDHIPFCDALAEQVGCKPAWTDIGRESRRFRRKFIAAPFTAAQYRLVGPHAKPEIARAVVECLAIVHPLPDRLNLRLRWTLSRALHRLLGPEYAPKFDLNPR
ncbi:MAG: flavin-containing monooxygenase [Steroidobacterales bacterium]